MNSFDLRNILKFPSAYQFLQNLVRNENHIKTYINDFLKIKERDKILDIGCGPADILAFFPEVDYLGFDCSPEYINNAQETFKNKGQFFCKNVSKQILEELDLTKKFDVVIANNVLHHLNNEEAFDLFEIAMKALKSNGRLITCDPCKVKEDNIISKIIISLDRGKYVRNADNYLSLASKIFSKVNYNITNKLSNIPITGIIIECQKD